MTAVNVDGTGVGEKVAYTGWRPEHQTTEAREAVQQWTARKMAAGEILDPHDPDMLMCLDKADIVSRYQLLLHQAEITKRDMQAHHDYERRRLIEAVGYAREWWTHCVKLRHAGRKTAQLADMPDRKEGDR